MPAGFHCPYTTSYRKRYVGKPGSVPALWELVQILHMFEFFSLFTIKSQIVIGCRCHTLICCEGHTLPWLVRSNTPSAGIQGLSTPKAIQTFARALLRFSAASHSVALLGELLTAPAIIPSPRLCRCVHQRGKVVDRPEGYRLSP